MSTSDSKESFFEEEAKESKNEEASAIKANLGSAYLNKNIIYKYKDGSTTTVVYNYKDKEYIQRNMY